MDVTATVNITKMVRLKNSTNGNGRWRVYWDGEPTTGSVIRQIGNAVTKPDSHVSIALTGNESGPFEITINGRYQIIDMEKVVR
jgi:hypothetical protein